MSQVDRPENDCDVVQPGHDVRLVDFRSVRLQQVWLGSLYIRHRRDHALPQTEQVVQTVGWEMIHLKHRSTSESQQCTTYVVHTHTEQLLLNLPFVNWPDTIPAVQLTLTKQLSARQDDTPPADCSGSTSVCGQTCSLHGPGSLQGSCGQLEQTDRQTDCSIT